MVCHNISVPRQSCANQTVKMRRWLSNVTESIMYSPHELRRRWSLVQLAALSLGFASIRGFKSQIPAKIPVWPGWSWNTVIWPPNVTKSQWRKQLFFLCYSYKLFWNWNDVVSPESTRGRKRERTPVRGHTRFSPPPLRATRCSVTAARHTKFRFLSGEYVKRNR